MESIDTYDTFDFNHIVDESSAATKWQEKPASNDLLSKWPVFAGRNQWKGWKLSGYGSCSGHISNLHVKSVIIMIEM